MFKSSVVNTVEQSKLTFNFVETHITAKDSRLYPSGHSESAMKTSRAGSFKPSTHPSNAPAWCEHHLSTTHNSSDCNSYKKWVSELRKGGFKKREKGKDKANATEDTPDPPENANIVMLALLHPYIICHNRGSNSQPHYDNSHYQLLHSLSYATPLV